jgi:cell division septum initiation protein DivIVA
MGIFIDTTLEFVSSSRLRLEEENEQLEEQNEKLERDIAALKSEIDSVRGDGKKLNDNYKNAIYRNTVLEKALQDANAGKINAEAKSAALRPHYRRLGVSAKPQRARIPL